MMRRLGVPREIFSIAALPALLPGVAIALSVSVPPVRAQGIDLTQGGPIQITAQNGIEWRQTEQVVIAKGDAKAVRGAVTVTADQLIAWYRRKAGAGPNQPPAGGVNKVAQSGSAQPGTTQSGPPQSSGGLADATQTEGNEVYRMRAEGNVHIYTQTDQGWGDQATYDLDQAVLVMTGNALKLTTPNDTLTARDTVEYWSQKHMAVARGDAVVVHIGRHVGRLHVGRTRRLGLGGPRHRDARQRATGRGSGREWRFRDRDGGTAGARRGVQQRLDPHANRHSHRGSCRLRA
jgi:lipopolysaccharide export system protein LptA